MTTTPQTGDGWMTRNAREMVAVAAFAGFDRAELVRRVALRSDPNRMTNTATVENVMAEMRAESSPANSAAE